MYQVSLGPRIPGSDAHREEGDWIIRELLSNGWKVETQEANRQGQPIRNIIGRFGEGSPWIIIDMIGDKDLNIYHEGNSDPILTEEIWISADQLGYSEYFINQTKYFMVDDHIPFVNQGISAVKVIDFDYPYWHTTADTIDKVSSNSLQIVGDTIIGWLTR